jgi:DNA-binding NtrC family response regulator
MEEKNIVIFEKYDGVRFVIERSLSKYEDQVEIYATNWKNDAKRLLSNQDVDLLITEISKAGLDGLEISHFARELNPDQKIVWITVLGCNAFQKEREILGDIKCVEKPLEVKALRKQVINLLLT